MTAEDTVDEDRKSRSSEFQISRIPIACHLTTYDSEETLQYHPLFVFPRHETSTAYSPLHDITKTPVAHLLIIEC